MEILETALETLETETTWNGMSSGTLLETVHMLYYVTLARDIPIALISLL